MEHIPGLICHVCDHGGGPGAVELIVPPAELETRALRAGWRYDEEDRWTCQKSLGNP